MAYVPVLDGYVRVSQVSGREGDSFISPDQQTDRITAWAQAYGHTIGQIFVELDQSGARADRPMLEQAIARIESGESAGLIVPRVDRFGRSLIDGLEKIARIDAAGGVFVSVQDGLDLSTDTGRLVLRIMLSLAEFDLERIRANWKDAQARAIKRGVHTSAKPPFGYRRERGKPLQVDPFAGPLVTELFRRRAVERHGFTELGRWLAAEGAVTQFGNPNFGIRAVKDILRNRVYLGVAFAGDVERDGAHPPLTDPDTWRLAQPNGQRFQQRDDATTSLARPLLRCAGCRYKMRMYRVKRKTLGETMQFECRSTGDGAWSCPEPASLVDRGALDEHIVSVFLAELPRLSARASVEPPRLAQVNRDVAIAREAFTTYRDDGRVQQALGMDAYLEGLSARQDALNAALVEQSAEQARARTMMLPADLSSVADQWSDLTFVQQRDLLEATIAAVFLRRASSGTPLSERVRVVFAADGLDLALPYRGQRTHRVTPFRFDGHDDAP